MLALPPPIVFPNVPQAKLPAPPPIVENIPAFAPVPQIALTQPPPITPHCPTMI